MAEVSLLTKIKNGLGIATTYHDTTLQLYIDEVKQFMLDSGVAQSVVDSDAAVGIILRGVADLWNYGSGNTTLSEYFKMRLVQLKNKQAVTPDV